jgi:two-component system LytT family response regulator
LGTKQVSLQKIALPTLDGFELVPIEDILHCEADSNYTHVVLKRGKKVLVSRTLKEIEELLDGHAFLRIHHSYLVNLNEIVRYVRGEGGYLIMRRGRVKAHLEKRSDRVPESLEVGDRPAPEV